MWLGGPKIINILKNYHFIILKMIFLMYIKKYYVCHVHYMYYLGVRKKRDENVRDRTRKLTLSLNIIILACHSTFDQLQMPSLLHVFDHLLYLTNPVATDQVVADDRHRQPHRSTSNLWCAHISPPTPCT